MRRRLSMIALLLIGVSCSALEDPEAGKGPITLSPGVSASLEEYMGRDAPLYFVVTENGYGSHYMYCSGGFNCDGPAARRQALDRCRSRNAGHDCKVYAIRRTVVWQGADVGAGDTASSARMEPQLSPSERLVRDCLDGATPSIRIDQCSQAIASSELAQSQKRGPFYVRARAYEEIGNRAEAEDDYRAVLRIDPEHAAAKARLARLGSPSAQVGPTQPTAPSPSIS